MSTHYRAAIERHIERLEEKVDDYYEEIKHVKKDYLDGKMDATLDEIDELKKIIGEEV